jgi:prepilin-type processing-associated H-X9-DG protein
MHRGLTLIEVLVLLFVISVALAALAMGCASARESARRATCESNQRQHTLALLQYDNLRRQFPGFRQKLAGQDASWVVMLLPYLDQDDLWQKWKAGTPQKACLMVMVCPSDWPDKASLADGPSAYAVNTKVCMDGKGLSVGYIADKDGTTCTLLISENLRIDKAHTWWDTDPLRVGFTNGPMAANIRSNHGGGAVAGFCDGHVMFLRGDLSDDLFKALVTPDGGEKVDESQL